MLGWGERFFWILAGVVFGLVLAHYGVKAAELPAEVPQVFLGSWIDSRSPYKATECLKDEALLDQINVSPHFWASVAGRCEFLEVKVKDPSTISLHSKCEGVGGDGDYIWHLEDDHLRMTDPRHPETPLEFFRCYSSGGDEGEQL